MNKDILAEQLETYRTGIAQQINNGIPITRILQHVEASVRLEGQIEAHRLFELGGKGELIRTLLQGSDDSWSGRGNDSKRVFFDGFRREAQEILDR